VPLFIQKLSLQGKKPYFEKFSLKEQKPFEQIRVIAQDCPTLYDTRVYRPTIFPLPHSFTINFDYNCADLLGVYAYSAVEQKFKEVKRILLIINHEPQEDGLPVFTNRYFGGDRVFFGHNKTKPLVEKNQTGLEQYKGK
jgi:hypothetical protein